MGTTQNLEPKHSCSITKSRNKRWNELQTCWWEAGGPAGARRRRVAHTRASRRWRSGRRRRVTWRAAKWCSLRGWRCTGRCGKWYARVRVRRGLRQRNIWPATTRRTWVRGVGRRLWRRWPQGALKRVFWTSSTSGTRGINSSCSKAGGISSGVLVSTTHTSRRSEVSSRACWVLYESILSSLTEAAGYSRWWVRLQINLNVFTCTILPSFCQNLNSLLDLYVSLCPKTYMCCSKELTIQCL